MRQALRKQTSAREPHRLREDADNGPVLNDEAVLAHLESYIDVDSDGDPVKGIAIALLFGTAIWVVVALVSIFVQLGP